MAIACKDIQYIELIVIREQNTQVGNRGEENLRTCEAVELAAGRLRTLITLEHSKAYIECSI